MPKTGTLNEGLRKRQEQSIRETEAKIIKALDKQKHASKINISKLERDSGVSRQQIAKRYNYLYDGRVSESKQVIKLKEHITEQQREIKRITQEKTALMTLNKELSDKLVQLYAIIDSLQIK